LTEQVAANFHPRELLAALAKGKVEFIVIGGIAVAMQGAVRETRDLDVLCLESDTNYGRLALALSSIGARLKGAVIPLGAVDPTLLQGMRIVTFDTGLGELDILFEAKGGIKFGDIVANAERVAIAGEEVLVASRPDLIRMKAAAGRPRDLVVIDELEALIEIEGAQGADPAALPEPAGHPEVNEDAWLNEHRDNATGGDEQQP